MGWLVSCSIFYRLSGDLVLYEPIFPTQARAAQEIAAILDERENERLHRVVLCMTEPLQWPIPTPSPRARWRRR